MADENRGLTTTAMLVISGVVGLLVLLALWLAVDYGFFGSLFLGLIVAAVLYLILFYGFGAADPAGARAARPAGSTGHVPASGAAASGTGAGAVTGAAAAGERGGADPASRDARPIDSTGATAGLDAQARGGSAPAAGSADKPDDAATAGRKAAADLSKGAAAGPSDTAAAASAATTGAAPKAAAQAPAPQADDPAAAPKAKKPASAQDVADEDGGTQPERMSAPRAGRPDDLKQFKGVGPKLEQMLHDHGIYHFDQIAGWGPSEIAWMDSNLKGFRGRVSRDDWIAQARTLAAGGETEFSKKVGKGGVY